MQHGIVLLGLLGGRLHLSPLLKDRPAGNILDVCCGTGIWAIDVADEHPDCYVTGVDLAPIQPTWVPPNVKFEVDDM